MNSIRLGELTQVDVREVWSLETDFTLWLAKKKNLKMLSDAIGIDELEYSDTEVSVSDFRADIKCKVIRSEGDEIAVIENQFGKTDHKHLGQILTYACGLKAKYVIWVAEEFRDEHRSALDRLNSFDSSGNEIQFFGVEIQVLRIGKSARAPKFSVVSMPNNWPPVDPTNMKHLAFWTQLSDHWDKESSFPSSLRKRPTIPAKRLWGVSSMPWSGQTTFTIRTERVPLQKRIRVALVLHGGEERERIKLFKALEKQKDKIENAIKEKFEDWRERGEGPLGRQSTVKAYLECEPDEESKWQEQVLWFASVVEKFANVFGKRMKDLPKRLEQVRNIESEDN